MIRMEGIQKSFGSNHVLRGLDLNIAKAMISTRQGQLIDVFYVLDRDGKKLSASGFLEELRQALLYSATQTC